jgi:hypothetical protein
MTQTWTPAELDAVGGADELRIASLRADGTLRAPVTIWVVRHDDDLYVRAYKGTSGAWYRGSQTRQAGHVEAGGVSRDVTFVTETGAALGDAIDAGYRAKYRRYDASYIDPMLAPPAREATLRLVPR